MMKNKKKTLQLLFIVMVVIGLMLCVFVDEENTRIAVMDKKELQYDANDWFIMIDLTEKLIGVYDGTEPLEHVKLKEDLSYLYTPIVVKWKELNIKNVTTEVPDWTPVFIYR